MMAIENLMNHYMSVLHIKKKKETPTWKKHSTVYMTGNQLEMLYISNKYDHQNLFLAL